MKRVTFLVIVLLAISYSPSSAVNPPKPGSPCPKVGKTETYKGRVYKCYKSGKKRVWDKGAVIPKATPTSSISASPVLSPQPTISATPSTTLSPTPQPSSSSDSTSTGPQVGQTCNQPLSRIGLQLICWQIQKPADIWQWTTYSTSFHIPYSLPKTATWRKIDPIPVAGAANQLQHARDGISKLSQELSHYWIEVDVDGGKTIAAAVWGPKSGSNFPVLVHFHGTGGLMYEDLEFAAQVAKKGYVTVVPIWWGPRPASVENVFPKNSQTVFENQKGPIFTGANLETSRMLLPVLKSATELAGVNQTKLALSGNSRGGTLALLIATTTPEVKAVVPIVAPFLPPQMQGIVSTPMTQGWETLPKSVVKELRQPTLVIAANNDQVVPPSSTRDYLEAAKASGMTNIQSAWIEGNHQLTFEYNPEYQSKTLKTLIDFLTIHLGPQ